MRKWTSLAAVVLAFSAGCSGSEDTPDSTASEPAESTEAAAPTAPLELSLTAPSGFSPIDPVERDVTFADDFVSYSFAVTGDEEGRDQITVTSYLLGEGVDTASYDTQASLVTDYYKQIDSSISLDNYYPTVVHRHSGIYRFGTEEVDGTELKWQDHFLFADRYLINITCQWDVHYSQVVSGCVEMTSSFPYPEDWQTAAAATS